MWLFYSNNHKPFIVVNVSGFKGRSTTMDKILSMCKKGELSELSNHLKDIPFGEVS